MNFTVLWVAVAVLAAVVEAATCGLVSIWFIPGAGVSLILDLCGVPSWIQIIAFFAISGVCLILCLKFFRKKFLKTEGKRMNADGLLGEIGVVTEEIDNLSEKGSVKIHYQTWSARADDDSVIPVGSKVRIQRISGVKLICKIEK